MITLEGNITNKLVTGTSGEFSVGTFATNIGLFKIKDKLLDEYAEGEYKARAVVRELRINSYPARRSGITINEILADVESIEILDFDIKPVTDPVVEPDASIEEAANEKVDDQPAPAVVKQAKPKMVLRRKQAMSTPTEESDSSDADLAKSFGPIWPLPDSFKLDKTLPRTTIIQQANYLKPNYEVDPRTQIWTKK